MNLINQLFFAVLISSATSTLMIFVWWLLRGFFMVTNAKLIYLTLRWTGIMYLLPIGYIAVLVTYRKWFQGQSRVWELVFIRAGELTDKLCIAAFIWFAAAVFLIASYMAERAYWNRKLADNILEDDPVITRVYRYVCTKLGIQPEKARFIQKCGGEYAVHYRLDPSAGDFAGAGLYGRRAGIDLFS